MSYPTNLALEPFLPTWRGWLAEYLYKPGWQFEIRDSGRLVVSAAVPDVDGRKDADGKPLLLTLARWTELNPPIRGPWHFEMILRDLIRQIEEHEFKEWFRRDGLPVDDPHPDPGVHPMSGRRRPQGDPAREDVPVAADGDRSEVRL
jgi:hypothetical protein